VRPQLEFLILSIFYSCSILKNLANSVKISMQVVLAFNFDSWTEKNKAGRIAYFH
jgi:hypothetical protein